MKKFINDPNELTKELLEGMCMAYPHKVQLKKEKLVCRAEAKSTDKVALISLGGTGHEPAVQGFVGNGMLDVCAAGDIWAAPGPPTLLEAMKEVKDHAGILLITLNHAGDIMSANMAKQMAEMEGIAVTEVVTKEEIRPTDEEEGRGLGGCFFVTKIAGAAAEAGSSMDDVVRIANKVNDNMKAIAVLSELATHPQTGGICGTLGDDEMEICAGQHGEGGGVTMKMESSKVVAELLSEKLIEKLGLVSGDEIALIVNGSGKTTVMEQYVSFRDAKLYIEEKGIKVTRGHAAEVLTVQEAGGYQLMALKLDDELTALWDASCDSPAYTVC